MSAETMIGRRISEIDETGALLNRGVHRVVAFASPTGDRTHGNLERFMEEMWIEGKPSALILIEPVYEITLQPPDPTSTGPLTEAQVAQ